MAAKNKNERDTEVQDVLKRMERVVKRADEFVLAFVRCNSPVQRKEMSAAFKARLPERRFLEITLEKPILSLLDQITASWDAADPPDVVCAYGLEMSINPERDYSPVLGRLNHDRELIRRACPVPLFIWLPDFALDCMVRGAPDFWAWRSGVYEFPTDNELWKHDSYDALVYDAPSIFSLDLEDKRAEIARLEELLRTSQSLKQYGNREQDLLANLLHQLGLLYQSLGDWDHAQQLFEQSLQIYQQLSDRKGIAASLHQLARLKQYQGNPAEAEQLFEQSLQIYQQLGNQYGIVTALHRLARLHLDRDDFAEAERLFQHSLQINQQLGNQHGISEDLRQDARLKQSQGNLAEAKRLYERSLQIKQQLGDKYGGALTLFQIGQLDAKQEQLHSALYNSVRAWMMLCELHSHYAALAQQNIRDIRMQVGEERFHEWLAEDFGKEEVKQILADLDQT